MWTMYRMCMKWGWSWIGILCPDNNNDRDRRKANILLAKCNERWRKDGFPRRDPILDMVVVVVMMVVVVSRCGKQFWNWTQITRMQGWDWGKGRGGSKLWILMDEAENWFQNFFSWFLSFTCSLSLFLYLLLVSFCRSVPFYLKLEIKKVPWFVYCILSADWWRRKREETQHSELASMTRHWHITPRYVHSALQFWWCTFLNFLQDDAFGRPWP